MINETLSVNTASSGRHENGHVRSRNAKINIETARSMDD